MVTECVPQSEADIHPVHSDPGVVQDLDTWHVTCHEAHQWPLSRCPNYRNKSANSGHQPRPVLLELKSEFGRDSDTNKISEEILEGCLKYCNHREISNSKLAPIFVLCLKISGHVSRASLYIRYWSMAHTVGTCVLRSWLRPTWRYQEHQWISSLIMNAWVDILSNDIVRG